MGTVIELGPLSELGITIECSIVFRRGIMSVLGIAPDFGIVLEFGIISEGLAIEEGLASSKVTSPFSKLAPPPLRSDPWPLVYVKLSVLKGVSMTTCRKSATSCDVRMTLTQNIQDEAHYTFE
jgi:hypothetical protein